MRTFARFCLSIGATVLFAGCALPLSLSKGQDDTQLPIGTPATVPQMQTVAGRASSPPYQVLYQFDGASGYFPAAPLIDVNGTLYGTTRDGGGGHGVVYSITTDGHEKVLHSFSGGSADGQDPAAGLLDVNGTLYGTTTEGGGNDCGTVYSISRSGKEKVLYSFRGGQRGFDGCSPWAPLIDVNGTLFGTTQLGGHGNGTVFSISTEGIEKVLYRFSRHNADGRGPWGGLVDVSGRLYGTTSLGGGCFRGGCGTVYSISTSGLEKVLYRFRGGSTDGATPIGGLIAVKGTLYGTTYSGGSSACNKTCGTVYSVTIQGTEKVLHYFARSDGAKPHAGLIFANGTLYGTTRRGGSGTGCLFGHNSGCGTVFSVSKSGVERVLHSFAGDSDGGNPVASLVDVNGTLYGTTANHLLHEDAVSTAFALTP
ncbi:MAG: choice-of-anchor tandem repeat GloVer-containing protein [Candidatus Cybelea sp.]